MALLFNTPLNDHEIAVFQSIQKAFGGPKAPVINPAYLPEHLRAAAERTLAGWCERHEMRHWPSWVTQWESEFRARQQSEASRTRNLPEHAGRDLLERGAAPGERPGPELGRYGCHGAEAESRQVG